MKDRVITAHIPDELATEVDYLAEQLERPRGWIVKEALTQYVGLEQARRIPENPRVGLRLAEFGPREVRRLIVSDDELRYELRGTEIFILRSWHSREDRRLLVHLR